MQGILPEREVKLEREVQLKPNPLAVLVPSSQRGFDIYCVPAGRIENDRTLVRSGSVSVSVSAATAIKLPYYF